MSASDLVSYRYPGIFWAAHKSHHDLVSDHCGVPRIVVDPVNLDDPMAVQVFLTTHWLGHQNANRFFNTTGPDLRDVDWKDPKSIEAWVDLNWLDHAGWDTAIAGGH